MNRPGAQWLTDELMQGEAALEALPALLQDARHLQAKSAVCVRVLTGIRISMSGSRLMASAELSGLRLSFLRQVRPRRRALHRRIAWLSWLRFWRASRYWIGWLILCLMVLTAVVWAVRNRDWLVGQIQIMLPEPSSPTTSTSPANPAAPQLPPMQPLASQPAPFGGAP